jgi:predicted  nucleic acid-binding Zn-ribbon protein
MVEQLNWALQNVDASNATVVTPTPMSHLPSVAGSYGVMLTGDGDDPQSTFNSIKSLIIKSADIVEAYYEEINKRLEEVYVAQSDFGDYAQRTSQEIEANSTSTTQRFENIQVIIANQGGDLETVKGSLQTIGQDISYTQNDIVTIRGNIDTLDSNLASVEGAVGSLDEELQSSKQELQGSVAAAKVELTGNINSAKTELSGMVEDVDSDLQETKTATNERIDDTNGSVANLGSGLNDANSRIAEVDQDLQEAKENISENIQGVRDSVTGVNALLEDAKAQLQGSLDDLEVYITGLQNVIIGVTAYLKSGLLYYTDAGIPVYGLEIGQSVKDEGTGTEVFNKYARFTSEKLSFYDNNGTEVAYISDKKLFIRIAEITVAFKIGGLIDLVMDSGDVVTKWVGKE